MIAYSGSRSTACTLVQFVRYLAYRLATVMSIRTPCSRSAGVNSGMTLTADDMVADLNLMAAVPMEPGGMMKYVGTKMQFCIQCALLVWGAEEGVGGVSSMRA